MDKIYAGVILIFVLAIMGGAIYSDYLRHADECRHAMAEQKYSAADIARVCR